MEEPEQVQTLLKMYRTRRKSTPGNSGVSSEVHETLLAMDQGVLSTVLRRRFQTVMTIAGSSSSSVAMRKESNESALLELLRAIFWAVPSSRTEGEKLRRHVFFLVIQMLTTTTRTLEEPNATAFSSTTTITTSSSSSSDSLGIPTKLANALVTLLLFELHYVPINAIPLLLEEILNSIKRVAHKEKQTIQQHQQLDPSTETNGFHALELVPQLLLRLCPCVSSRAVCSASQSSQESSQVTVGSDFKDELLERFVAMEWPRALLVPVMKAFRDFPFSEDQERAFCCKLFTEMNKFLAAHSEWGDEAASSSSFSSNPLAKTTDMLGLVPTLICQALQLVRKFKSTFCRKILMHCVLKLLAVVTPGPRNALSTFARERLASSSASNHSSCNRKQLLNSFTRELRAVQSSILYQLDLLLKQDDVVVVAFLSEFKTRTLQPLSSFEIALLLTAAAHLAHQAMVMSFLTQYIITSYVEEHPASGSRRRSGRYGPSRRSAFLDAVSFLRECGWEVIAEMSVELGFQVLASAKNSAWMKPANNVTPLLGAPTSLSVGVAGAGAAAAASVSSLSSSSSLSGYVSSLWIGFGIRLVLSAFQNHRSIRRNVIDRIVHVIIVQSSELDAAIKLLARILKRHTVEIDQQLLWKIREALEYICLLQVAHARALFTALAPLLMLRPDLKDYMILILRKMVFKREPEPRIVGISGLAFLLGLSAKTLPSRRASLTQLYSQSAELPGFGLSQSMAQLPLSGSSQVMSSQVLSQQRVNILKSDDLFRQFCGVFKRALHFQTQVRKGLYHELALVFEQCPTIRQSVLELIWNHFAQFYDQQPAMVPPVRLDLCLGHVKQGKYVEPFAELLHLLVTICRVDFRREQESSLYDESEDLLMDTALDVVDGRASVNGVLRLQQVAALLKSLVSRLKRCELEDFDLDKTSSFDAEEPLGQSNLQLAGLLLGSWEVCMDYLASSSCAVASENTTNMHDSDEWDAMAVSIAVASWQTIKPDVLVFFRLYCQLCDRIEAQQARANAIKNKTKAKSHKTKDGQAPITLKRKRTSLLVTKAVAAADDALSISCYQRRNTLLLSGASVVTLLRGVCMEITEPTASPNEETRRLAVFLLNKASQVVHKWVQEMNHETSEANDQDSGADMNSSTNGDTRRVNFNVCCSVVGVDNKHKHMQAIAALSLRMFWFTRWIPPRTSDGAPARRGRKLKNAVGPGAAASATIANESTATDTTCAGSSSISSNVNSEALHVFCDLAAYLCRQTSTMDIDLVAWMTSVFTDAQVREEALGVPASPLDDQESEQPTQTAATNPPTAIIHSLSTCLDLLRRKLDGILCQQRVHEAALLLQGIHHIVLSALEIEGESRESFMKPYLKWIECLIEQRQLQSHVLLEKCIELALCWHRLANSSAFVFSNRLAVGLVFFCNGHESSSGFAHIDEARNFVKLDGLEEKKVLSIATALLNEVEFSLTEAEALMKTWKQAQAMKNTKRTALKEEEQLLLAQLEMENRLYMDTSTTRSRCTPHAAADDASEREQEDTDQASSHLRPVQVHQVEAASTLEQQDALLSETLYGICTLLLPFVLIDLNKPMLSNRIMRLVIRCYKLLVVYVNAKVRKKTTACWNGALEKLINRSAAQLTPAILHYIACVHEENKRNAIAAASKSLKKRRRKTTPDADEDDPTPDTGVVVVRTTASKSSSGAASVQSRVIPDAIFQLEQYDVALIRLSKLFPERDFSLWCQLRQSRDFRFNRDRLEASIVTLQQQEQQPQGEEAPGVHDEQEQEIHDHESDEDDVAQDDLREQAEDDGDQGDEEEEEEEVEDEEVELTATAPHALEEVEREDIPENHESSETDNGAEEEAPDSESTMST